MNSVSKPPPISKSNNRALWIIISTGIAGFSYYSYADSKKWLKVVQNARPIEEHPNYSVPTASQGFFSTDDTFSDAERDITLSTNPTSDIIFKAKGKAFLPPTDRQPLHSLYMNDVTTKGIFYQLQVNRSYRTSRTVTSTKEDGSKETKTIEENKIEEVLRVDASKAFELRALDEMSNSVSEQTISYDPSTQTNTPKLKLSEWQTIYHQMKFATASTAELIPKEVASKESFISAFGPVHIGHWHSNPLQYSFATNHYTIEEKMIPEGTPITIYAKDLNSQKQIQNPVLIVDKDDEVGLAAQYNTRKNVSLGATTLFSGITLYSLLRYMFMP